MVPVPEAEFLHHRWPDERVHMGVPGLPLHVTVLYPFLGASAIDRGVERELEELVGSRSPFEYELSAIGRFPGVMYLAPSPADGFVALTHAVHARWPSHPLYGGAYDEILPHVTLILGDEPAGFAAAIQPTLPITAVARELLLMASEPDGTWSRRAGFRLGG